MQTMEKSVHEVKVMGSVPTECMVWTTIKFVPWILFKSLWTEVFAKCINTPPINKDKLTTIKLFKRSSVFLKGSCNAVSEFYIMFEFSL